MRSFGSPATASVLRTACAGSSGHVCVAGRGIVGCVSAAREASDAEQDGKERCDDLHNEQDLGEYVGHVSSVVSVDPRPP